MSSSVPCESAYDLSVSSLFFQSVAATLGIVSFVYYVIKVHRNPNMRFVQTKYDLESASAVLILSIIAGMSSSVVTVMNGNCGDKCPTETLTCNSQMGSSASTLVSAMGISITAIMKIFSLYYQVEHPLKPGDNVAAEQ